MVRKHISLQKTFFFLTAMFAGPKLWSLKNRFFHTNWILAVMGVGKWVVEELGESIKKGKLVTIFIFQ